MVPELLVSLIIGLFGGGGLINFFHLRSNEKKANADVASTIVGAAGQMIELYEQERREMEEKIDELEAHVRSTEERLRAVEAERDHLERKVESLEQKVHVLEGRQHLP